MINIQEILKPYWPQIEKATNINGNIGTSLQDSLHHRVNAIIPINVGYFFDFNMSGQCWHIFYDKMNPENKIVL